jgi:hypothetical protein
MPKRGQAEVCDSDEEEFAKIDFEAPHSERGFCNSIALEMKKEFEEEEKREGKKFIKTNHPGSFQTDEDSDDEAAHPSAQTSEEGRTEKSDNEEMTYQEWLGSYLLKQKAKKLLNQEEFSELKFEKETTFSLSKTKGSLVDLLTKNTSEQLTRSTSNSTQSASDEEDETPPTSSFFSPKKPTEHDNPDEIAELIIGADFFTRYPELASRETGVPATGETERIPGCLEELDNNITECFLS